MEIKIVEGEESPMAENKEVVAVNMKGALYGRKDAGNTKTKTSDRKD